MAWTVTASFDQVNVLGSGEKQFVFNLACTSDASSSGDQKLSTLLAAALGAKMANFYMEQIRGGLFYGVSYEPDGTATPTTDPVVTVDNEDGTIILSRTFTAATADFEPGTNQTGMYIPITDLIFASDTMANAKIANFRLIVSK